MEVLLRWGYAVRLLKPVTTQPAARIKAAEVIRPHYSSVPPLAAVGSIASPRYSISYVAPAASCPACSNVYMADSVYCRHCGRKRDTEASVLSTSPKAAMAVTVLSPRSTALSPRCTQAQAVPVQVMPVSPRGAVAVSPQGAMPVSPHCGVRCLASGSVFTADSISCRQCGNNREEVRLQVVPALQQSQSNAYGHVMTDASLSPRTPVVSAGRLAEPLVRVPSMESSPRSLRLEGLRLATRNGWLPSRNEARDASPMSALEMR